MFLQLASSPSLCMLLILGLLALSNFVQAIQFPLVFPSFSPLFLIALLLAFGSCLFRLKHVLEGW